jgi:hypothetical protein
MILAFGLGMLAGVLIMVGFTLGAFKYVISHPDIVMQTIMRQMKRGVSKAIQKTGEEKLCRLSMLALRPQAGHC